MPAFFDTSALIPLVVHEMSTPLCRRIFDGEPEVAVSRVTLAEASAALALAERRGRIVGDEWDRVWAEFLSLWDSLIVVEVSAALVETAAELARPYGLKGFDAIQCASALAIASDDIVAVTGDRRLLAAWGALGLLTADAAARS